MKNLIPRNILLCVVPAVVVLLSSIFWFKKKKRKLTLPPKQNASSIAKTVACDSQTSIYSSADCNSDFSSTLSDASSISSPENFVRKESSCESSRINAANSSEVYSVSDVIECLKIQDMSTDENKVYANQNSLVNTKEIPGNTSKVEMFQGDNVLSNGVSAVDLTLEVSQPISLEKNCKTLHTAEDMLQSSVSYDESSANHHYVGLSNGLYSNEINLNFHSEDQHSLDIKDSGFGSIIKDQISPEFQNTFLTSVLNDQSKTTSVLPDLKMCEADSHSSVLDENSLSSISDESDRHADFKSKDSPSSVFDGNSICDESEKTDESNEQGDNMKMEENGNVDEKCIKYKVQPLTESNEQYSIQLNKNSFFANSLLLNEEISSTTLEDKIDEPHTCLQNSDQMLHGDLAVISEVVCDSKDVIPEYHNQHLLKEVESYGKEISPIKTFDIKTVSSTSDEGILYVSPNSCNQAERQSETADICDSKVSSSIQETLKDEIHKTEQSDSVSSVLSTVSETSSIKSQENQLESLNQNKVSGLEMIDIKNPGMIPGLYVYEFDLPQEFCGRLIGKQGKYVKSIKERTNANILIKRHPFDNNLKTVVVEGSRSSVFEALDVIRRKFPPSQFPSVTLIQTNMMSSHAISLPESLQLHLPEGASCDVILSSLVSAGHFFLQQPTHPSYPSLSTLDQCMISCYSQMDTPLLPHPIEAGVICAAPVMNGWFRAQVIYVFENGNECEIKFVDYGGFSQVLTSSLRQIRSDFMTLPFQASECYLASVRPVDRNAGWSAEATSVFEELAQGQILQALLVEYAEYGVPCVHLYRVQGVSNMFINQELVERGLAVWVDNSHLDPH